VSLPSQTTLECRFLVKHAIQAAGAIPSLSACPSHAAVILCRGRTEEVQEGLCRGRTGEVQERLCRGRTGEVQEGLCRGRTEEVQEGLCRGRTEEVQEGLCRGRTEEVQEGLCRGRTEEVQEGLCRGRTEEVQEGQLCRARAAVQESACPRHASYGYPATALDRPSPSGYESGRLIGSGAGHLELPADVAGSVNRPT
jgi:hypothetical protein